MLGNGLIGFGNDITSNTSFTDISGESRTSANQVGKIANHIPFNEYFTVSMVFSFEYMQIKINDEIRYISNKEQYMKSKSFPVLNQKGLEVKINCSKRSELVIKDFTITEYENDVPEAKITVEDIPSYKLHTENTKNSFDFCISQLSKELQDEIKQTNDYVLGLQPLKLKRKIQGTGMTYVSDYGFSYFIRTDGNSVVHSMQWILYNTHREQQKYGGKRKRELTNKTLDKLAETSPDFAERMFNNLEECFGCACHGVPKSCKFDGCVCCEKIWGLCPTLITYNGEKKAACHGRMAFNMLPSDFADVRKVIGTINEILKTDFTS